MSELNYLTSIKNFSESIWIDGDKKWVQLYPYTSFDHPKYGHVEINHDIAQKFVENFDKGVRGQEIHSDYEHGLDSAKGNKASGKYLKVEARDNGVFGLVQFTEEAKKEIDAGEWNYWSESHFDTWTHPQTGEKFDYVLGGGGLTNQPFIKDMVPLNFSELMLVDPEIKEAGEKVLAAIEPIIDDEPVIDNEPVVIPTTDEDGMDELLKKFSELFGLPEDATEEAVLAYASEMKADIEPLRELQKNSEQKKAFSESFPDEAKELAESRKYRQEQEAKSFSESLISRRVTRKITGDDDAVTEQPTGLGFSALAIEQVGEVVKKFSEGTVTVEDFKQFTESVLDNGIVDYSTAGSSREDETDPEAGKLNSKMTSQDTRKMFSERIQKLADDEFDGNFVAAYAESANRWPDEFDLYRKNKPLAGAAA